MNFNENFKNDRKFVKKKHKKKLLSGPNYHCDTLLLNQ